MSSIHHLVNQLRNDLNLVSFCDLVLNHTACETPWLLEHPECAHNLHNSPHLRPAYILDSVIYEFLLDVGRGKTSIPTALTREEEINQIGDALKNNLIPAARIAEFFLVDIKSCLEEFKEYVSCKQAAFSAFVSANEFAKDCQQAEIYSRYTESNNACADVPVLVPDDLIDPIVLSAYKLNHSIVEELPIPGLEVIHDKFYRRYKVYLLYIF